MLWEFFSWPTHMVYVLNRLKEVIFKLSWCNALVYHLWWVTSTFHGKLHCKAWVNFFDILLTTSILRLWFNMGFMISHCQSWARSLMQQHHESKIWTTNIDSFINNFVCFIWWFSGHYMKIVELVLVECFVMVSLMPLFPSPSIIKWSFWRLLHVHAQCSTSMT